LHAKPHTPPAHVALPLAGAVQTCPHDPQLDASVARLVQLAPHIVGIEPPHPLTHMNDDPVRWHSGAAPEQLVVHDPQCGACERSASHPFAGLPSQSPKPALHETPHRVPSHVAVPFAGAGQAMHALPHEATLLEATHVAPHRCCPGGHPHAAPSHGTSLPTSSAACTSPPSPADPG
jgi:hypothetical protein